MAIHVRDEKWIQKQSMGSFLSVARGSDEKPVFLELVYDGCRGGSKDQDTFALVGKGGLSFGSSETPADTDLDILTVFLYSFFN